MAVAEEIFLYPTENLISTQRRRHLRTSVAPLHWQLRCLLGIGSNGVVYFPSGADNRSLQRLDTRTLETDTVTALAFAPRCLVAHDGWVCCGGEYGEFVAIAVEAPVLTNGLDRPPVWSRRGRSMFTTQKKIGKERVNCITMWFPSPRVNPQLGAYKEPVAVLANNDKHVTVVQLPPPTDSSSTGAIENLEYPDCINRALISPDGRLLVAIGDDPYMYLHERAERLDPEDSSSSADSPTYYWKQVRKIPLKGQMKHDPSEHRGSFAACFSDTGLYLAVGTQYGMICVFDTNALPDRTRDPLLAYFPSSRPTPYNKTGRDLLSPQGAIRDMAFSPGPYELLAWTEDNGRVGVADIRSGFALRQVLHLDPEDEHTEHLDLRKRSAIDPRLLVWPGEREAPLPPRISSTSETVDSRVRRHMENVYNRPFTGAETEVLEAFQSERRRREQLAAREAMGIQSRGSSRGAGSSASATSSTAPSATTLPTALPRLHRELLAGSRMLSSSRPHDGRERRDRVTYETLRQALRSTEPVAGTEDLATERQEVQRQNLELERHRQDLERQRQELERLERQQRQELERQQRRWREVELELHRHVPPPRDAPRQIPGGQDELPGVDTTDGDPIFEAPAREGQRHPATSLIEAYTGRYFTSSQDQYRDYTPTDPLATLDYLHWMLHGPEQLNGRDDSPTAEGGNSTAPESQREGDPEQTTAPTLAPATAAPATTTTTTTTTAASPSQNPSSWSRLVSPDAALWPRLISQVTVQDSAQTSFNRRMGTRPLGDGTAGLSWGEDGSILYIASENGIYEFRVDAASRKTIPSVELR